MGKTVLFGLGLVGVIGRLWLRLFLGLGLWVSDSQSSEPGLDKRTDKD